MSGNSQFLRRHARDPRAVTDGYETFTRNDDWWQEDRVTTALRAVPTALIVVEDDNYYMDLLERMGLVKRLDGTRATPDEVRAAVAALSRAARVTS